MAQTRVVVYEDPRGWRYYWREGDAFAYMLRADLSRDLAGECANLEARATPPPASVGCRWTPELFDDSLVRLIAIYEHGRLRRMG
ncbi:MAG TPA: hypothetical protein VIC27_11545 [Ktedonobacterales bacterium]